MNTIIRKLERTIAKITSDLRYVNRWLDRRLDDLGNRARQRDGRVWRNVGHVVVGIICGASAAILLIALVRLLNALFGE